MAFVTLEDMKGSIEIIVFPELYRRRGALLKEDDPLIVSGQLDVSEESCKVIGRDLMRLQEAMQKSGIQGVHIQLKTPHVSKEQLERLRGVLQAHRGFTPTFIHFNDPKEGETVLTLPEDLCAQPSEDLVRAVDQLFGTPVTQLH